MNFTSITQGSAYNKYEGTTKLMKKYIQHFKLESNEIVENIKKLAHI